MARFPIRSALVLAGIEATPGTEESLTPAANAVRVESPQFAIQGEVDNGENEVTNSLDAGDPIPLGVGVNAQFNVRAKGSNAGGTAPEYAPLLRASSLGETLIAADVTGSLQAGSTATSLVLAVGDGANVTIGQVIEITSGAQSGEKAVITAISSDTVTVTPALSGAPSSGDGYNARASAIYAPVSLDQETASLYFYRNPAKSADSSILTKMVGSMFNMTLEITNRGLGRFGFNGRGILPANPADVASPTGEVYDAGSPPTFTAADAYLDDLALKMQSASWDLRNAVGQPPDPASADGLDFAHVGGRRIGGSITAVLASIADKDVIADFKAGTSRKLWLRWGATPGQQLSVLMTDARYDGPPSDSEIEQSAGQQLPIRANGIDAGFYLSIY